MVTLTRPRTDLQPVTHLPQYELRARNLGGGSHLLEVWELPGPATPHLKAARRLAGLHGRNLLMVEHRLLKHLQRQGVDATGLLPGEARRSPITEDEALRLGLLFRVLAPMRSTAHMEACVQGVEGMPKEEAAYWLGMAMYRRHPRRVLMALRFLLIDPKLA